MQRISFNSWQKKTRKNILRGKNNDLSPYFCPVQALRTQTGNETVLKNKTMRKESQSFPERSVNFFLFLLQAGESTEPHFALAALKHLVARKIQ